MEEPKVSTVIVTLEIQTSVTLGELRDTNKGEPPEASQQLEVKQVTVTVSVAQPSKPPKK